VLKVPEGCEGEKEDQLAERCPSVALPNSMAVTRTMPMTEAVMPSRNGATMDHAQAELTAKTHF